MDCGSGVVCPFTRNISGFARGIALDLLGFVWDSNSNEIDRNRTLEVYRQNVGLTEYRLTSSLSFRNVKL